MAATTLGRLSRELRWKIRADPDGRVRLDLASTFSPRTAAVLRPCNVLTRAGVPLAGFEALDLVWEPGGGSLADAVEAWDRHRNRGPHRHRLEVLAGRELLESCLERLHRESGRSRGARSPAAAWRFAAGCVAFNTPGSERRMLSEVLAADEDTAHPFLNNVIDRARLAVLAGEPFEVPADALVELVRRPSYLGERATDLAATMPPPLPEAVADALAAVCRQGGRNAVAALGALHNAAPSDHLRQTVEDALQSGDPNLQAAALGVLARHWGTDARPVWRRFLASRSAPLRWTAQQVLGAHGTVEDLPDAADHLARIARTKGQVYYSPPRGAELVDLLVRHRDHPVARAALDDLSARWERLRDDLRDWLAANHGWLDPAQRQDRPEERDAGPEPPLRWPQPGIERDGDVLRVWFGDTDMFDTRERFEERAAGHGGIELLDGDREWTAMRVDADDPEALIRELWVQAGGDAPPPDRPS